VQEQEAALVLESELLPRDGERLARKPRRQNVNGFEIVAVHREVQHIMSRFVIADLTDAKSVLQELSSIVLNCPSVIVQPLLLASQELPGMWDFFCAFPWVLEPVRYTHEEELIATLDEKVIAPAEARALRSQSR